MYITRKLLRFVDTVSSQNTDCAIGPGATTSMDVERSHQGGTFIIKKNMID